MYFPFLSQRSLERRKGGGGKGGGSSGGSSGGKSTGGSTGSTGSGGSAGTARSSGVSAGGTTKSATSYGNGGGVASTIPSGQIFSGRSEGGATRGQVFGSPVYGSGYPGVVGRGVAGRGFPFVFWPLAWGGIAGAGSAAYLHDSEYGRADNTSRPGGIMMTAAFPSSSQNTTFRVIADNTTVNSLIVDLTSNCSSSITSPTTIVATAYNDTSSAPPQPEQAVQYYRASSVALTLDGYNNTGALAADGTPNTPLPTAIDTTLLNCLNMTIGAAVPLVGNAMPSLGVPPPVGFIGLTWVIWCLSSLF